MTKLIIALMDESKDERDVAANPLAAVRGSTEHVAGADYVVGLWEDGRSVKIKDRFGDLDLEVVDRNAAAP